MKTTRLNVILSHICPERALLISAYLDDSEHSVSFIDLNVSSIRKSINRPSNDFGISCGG